MRILKALHHNRVPIHTLRLKGVDPFEDTESTCGLPLEENTSLSLKGVDPFEDTERSTLVEETTGSLSFEGGRSV